MSLFLPRQRWELQRKRKSQEDICGDTALHSRAGGMADSLQGSVTGNVHVKSQTGEGGGRESCRTNSTYKEE